MAWFSLSMALVASFGMVQFEYGFGGIIWLGLVLVWLWWHLLTWFELKVALVALFGIVLIECGFGGIIGYGLV